MGSPTAALLWAACRPVRDDDTVADSVRDGADLSTAASVAIAQRVSPQLWRALDAVGVTDNALTQLQRDATRCRAQSLLLMPRLGPLLLDPLAKAGFEPLLFKGAALAPRYPEVGLRPMDDVDLILPPDQVDDAIDTLVAVGWRVRQGPAGRTHEVDLVHEALPGIPLDLHRELTTWRDRTNRLTAVDLWKWRRPIGLYGAPCYTLPPEPELVALAAHAAKPFHTFDRLMWSVDVAVVITATRGDIDWPSVVQLARETQCTTALGVMLRHASFLGVETPIAPSRAVRARSTRSSTLAPLLSSEWPLRRPEAGTQSLLRYALIDTWRGRAVLATSDIIDEGPRAVPARARDLAARSLRQWLSARRRRSEDGGEDVGNAGQPRRVQR